MDKNTYRLDSIESNFDGDGCIFWLTDTNGQALFEFGDVTEELRLSNVVKLMGKVASGGYFKISLPDNGAGRFTLIHKDIGDEEAHSFDPLARLNGLRGVDVASELEQE